MARVILTASLKRHVESPVPSAPGSTVREVLDRLFSTNPQLRSHVLDERGGLKDQMGVLVDGVMLADRQLLSDSVEPDSTVYVLQSSSGE